MKKIREKMTKGILTHIFNEFLSLINRFSYFIGELSKITLNYLFIVFLFFSSLIKRKKLSSLEYNKYSNLLSLSYKFFVKNRLRSYLTVLGVIIGVSTILVVSSISEGLVKDVEKEFEGFGRDKLIVVPYSELSPSFGRRIGNKLFESDVEEIENIEGVKSISYAVWARATIEYEGKAVDTAVYGVNGKTMFEQWKDYFKIREGRLLKDKEGFSALLAYNIAEKIFGKSVEVGKNIKINGIEFRVVGTLEKFPGQFSSTDDDAVYVPLEKARLVFGDLLLKDEINFIVVEAVDENRVEELKEKIETRLSRKRNVPIEDKPFSVITYSYIIEQTSIVLGLVYTIGIIISSISLFVGGIGIVNVIYSSVVEKKKEIGIMRALGMTKGEVKFVFLFESMLIGVFGSILALMLTILIGIISYYVEIPFSFNPLTLISGIIYGVGVGLISGYLPAKEALKITPMEAVKYG